MSGELTEFPRPNVAVDLAVLTVRPAADDSGAPDHGRLATLVQHRSSAGDVLPGRFIRERETVSQTVATLLTQKVGLSPATRLTRSHPTLLRVFDDPVRDSRSWTLSLGYSVALPWDHAVGASGRWVPVDEKGGAGRARLNDEHDEIVRLAVTHMRERYETAPDPDGLLPGAFTLLDLRRVHEAVLGEPIRKDTFNRRMRDLLEPTDAPEEEDDLPVRVFGFVASAPPAPSGMSTAPRNSPTKPRSGGRRVGRPAQYYRNSRPLRGSGVRRLPREES